MHFIFRKKIKDSTNIMQQWYILKFKWFDSVVFICGQTDERTNRMTNIEPTSLYVFQQTKNVSKLCYFLKYIWNIKKIKFFIEKNYKTRNRKTVPSQIKFGEILKIPFS